MPRPRQHLPRTARKQQRSAQPPPDAVSCVTLHVEPTPSGESNVELRVYGPLQHQPRQLATYFEQLAANIRAQLDGPQLLVPKAPELLLPGKH